MAMVVCQVKMILIAVGTIDVDNWAFDAQVLVKTQPFALPSWSHNARPLTRPGPTRPAVDRLRFRSASALGIGPRCRGGRFPSRRCCATTSKRAKPRSVANLTIARRRP
jgi:hypothetical protein